MENVTKFGERLLELRVERNETQLDLANAIGITRQSLSRYETNERIPNIDLIYSVAKHYNVSTDYLLGMSEIKSLDNDIKIACNVTGLSDETIKNIKLAQTSKLSFKLSSDVKYSEHNTFYETSDIIDMILSSKFFLEQIDLIGIYFNELINKYFKKIIIDDYYDEISKFNDIENENRLKLYDVRNKIQKEWEDLGERTFYNEFRLTKKFSEFLSHVDCIAKETANKMQKEREKNAEHNPTSE